MDDSPATDQEAWEAPDKRFTKIVTSKGYGFYCPHDGSVCKVKVITDEMKILSEVNEDMIKELIVGDVDDPIDRILEACLRTMKTEEICVLKFPDPSQPLKSNELTSSLSEPLPGCNAENSDSNLADIIANVDSVIKNACSLSPSDDKIQASCNDVDSLPSVSQEGQSTEADVPNVDASKPKESLQLEDSIEMESYDGMKPIIYEVNLQLLCYTREPEIWEMSITEKWRRANYHKQKGMELYARGSYEWAFRRFGLSLKYVISLEHDVPSGQEEGMNISGLKLSCYLNLAACQMRHYNYTSVASNCTKALAIQSDNPKALYRRGSAYTQLQEYEKAKADLDKALELEPKNQAVVKQQQILKARVQKLNEYYASVMKKMFL